MDDKYVVGIEEVDRAQVARVGGKGAHLGELARLDGIRVPPGFFVTTDAFRMAVAEVPSLDDRLDRLSALDPGDRDAIGELSAEIRRTIEGTVVPGAVAAAISFALGRLGEDGAYAVRSSATAEDLPTASFAGQHDSYLNVVGAGAVLAHVSRCWASLFTEQAVTYRLRNGFGQRGVQMGVVVQRMVDAHAAGVLFTADPVTSNRRVSAVEAVLGLGEALVSGRAGADGYRVRDGAVVARTLTGEEPVLSDAQVVALAELGRRIEAHLGHPQDIEWCLRDDDIAIVQSRPITTLFPIPAAADGENHVYVSVGHQQMMTDPMTSLGLSVFALTALPPMHEAGGRLFVDVTARLASPASRAALLDLLGRSDPLIRDALQTVLDRGDFVPSLPDDGPGGPPAGEAPARLDPDPSIVEDLIAHNRASVAALASDIDAISGPELFDFILADIVELKRILFDPRSHQVIMAGMEASWWLNERLETWLGEKNAADTLTRSVPGNVTSEMGLALLDVADVIRAHPDVVAFLECVDVDADDDLLESVAGLDGGPRARDAIRAYLDRYGMRCVGEIDITRPRWSERPAALVPALLGNVRAFAPGEGRRRFEQGRREARDKEQELLERLRALPQGELKADETKRTIDRVRTFAGYREYPKYGIVSRYALYKRALLREAERLVRAGMLHEKEDCFHLTFQEFHEAVRANAVDGDLIARRKHALRSHRALTPPRVLTSDGEVVAGTYRRDDAPAGALVGLAVSGGTVEGRARIVTDLAAADLEPGDILVTAYTDPSWSPVFVGIKGLVTEVGGLMTHGAVIAREYGLPAVVGVERATRLIPEGRRIRVHGTDGFVEVLP